jgi:hypothetical protein
MGSVPKPRCARGQNCYHVLRLRSELPSTVSRDGDLCEKCQRHYAEDTQTLRSVGWRDKVIEAIQALRPGNALLCDLFTLNPDNGGWGEYSDRGEVLMRLDAHTLTKLRDWLEENRDRAVELHGYHAWLRLRTEVGLLALLAPLPPKMQLSPDKKDGLPLEIGAVRTNGKTWDLNIPIRAELLRRAPRYFSERDYGKLLGMSRRAYRRLRDAINEESFTLDKFTPDVLDRIVRGEKRGPK